jgi:hypothetical protein
MARAPIHPGEILAGELEKHRRAARKLPSDESAFVDCVPLFGDGGTLATMVLPRSDSSGGRCNVL